jgi:hypothetical protein
MAAVMTGHHLEARMTHMRFFGDAISETGVTGSKNIPQYAVAGDIFTIPTKLTQSNTVAVRAGFLRQRDGFRAGPVDFHECSLWSLQWLTTADTGELKFSKILVLSKIITHSLLNKAT